jgi:hypothetical protein
MIGAQSIFSLFWLISDAQGTSDCGQTLDYGHPAGHDLGRFISFY